MLKEIGKSWWRVCVGQLELVFRSVIAHGCRVLKVEKGNSEFWNPQQTFNHYRQSLSCKTKYKMSPSSVRSEGGEEAAGYCLNSVSYRVDKAVKYNVLNSDKSLQIATQKSYRKSSWQWNYLETKFTARCVVHSMCLRSVTWMLTVTKCLGDTEKSWKANVHLREVRGFVLTATWRWYRGTYACIPSSASLFVSRWKKWKLSPSF